MHCVPCLRCMKYVNYDESVVCGNAIHCNTLLS